MSVLAPNLQPVRRSLLRWYGNHRRDLPWRSTNDPYAIWVSEIMLQQTRVAAVFDKYRLFLGRFPTVGSLAEAEIEQVLAVWSGLGYYRRARQLHLAAQTIIRERNGTFPTTAETWRELPGIGRYTAAAIASIAFAQPTAVVDGNVERVIVRLFGTPHKGEQLWTTAQSLLDPASPGDWNQAMMELGATLCTPVQPQCTGCPLKRWCRTLGAHQPRLQAPRRRSEFWHALHERSGKVLLVQRGISERRMAGMWELPAVHERSRSAKRLLYRLRHSITDTDYTVFVIQGSGRGRGVWTPLSQIARIPITGLTLKILRRHFGDRLAQ